MRLEAIIGMGSTLIAGAVSALPSDPDAIDALGRWPVTLALVALAGWSVWLMYRQADRARESMDRLGEQLGHLRAELRERPCVRDPKND